MEIYAEQTAGCEWKFRLCHDTGSACYVRGNFKINSDTNIMILTSLSDNEMEELENSVYDIACVRDIVKL